MRSMHLNDKVLTDNVRIINKLVVKSTSEINNSSKKNTKDVLGHGGVEYEKRGTCKLIDNSSTKRFCETTFDWGVVVLGKPLVFPEIIDDKGPHHDDVM